MGSESKGAEKGAVTSLGVLIVEDEPAAREACSLYLERCGHDVTTAAGAAEAIAAAKRRAPDVAICDWRLGAGGNGVDVARELQRAYGTAIIFMTAYPIDELRELTGDLDVLRYVRKPVSLADLAGAIATLGDD